jgi:hypothetical protein
MSTEIAGYTYGDQSLEESPVTAEDVERLKAALLWSEADDRYLQMAGEVLEDQVEDVLDLWYGFVGSHPHLVHHFTDADGQPIGEYLERVRARFAQWVHDVCRRPYDDEWRAYQHEIALRHTAAKKNRTDDVASVPEIPMRYIVAFIVPITVTMRSFLDNRGRSKEDVDGMQSAWFKAVVLHVCLWTQPYANESW